MISDVLFVIAQGAAIFITAYLAARLLHARHWAAKTALMIVSFAGWIAFTFWLMFWGVNSYLVFFGVVRSAAESSAVFWALWVFVPIALKATSTTPKLGEARN